MKIITDYEHPEFQGAEMDSAVTWKLSDSDLEIMGGTPQPKVTTGSRPFTNTERMVNLRDRIIVDAPVTTTSGAIFRPIFDLDTGAWITDQYV